MSWITWLVILVVWPLVGLAVAYLFGRFTARGEVYGDAGDISSPIVSYLRPAKRTRAPSRAASQPKAPREATAGRRVH